MQNASSASRTCSEPRSASEYTATVLSPSSRHARMIRTAISPRFAIRTLENIAKNGVFLRRAQAAGSTRNNG